MCMTKTLMNMDSHTDRIVHKEKPFKKSIDSHLYKYVHDENRFTMKWIVIHTNMSMTKTNKNMDSHSY